MAVFKAHKNENYTVLSNFHFKETGMSLKAKGLLSMMLSLPPEWDYSVEGLITLSSDGETSVRSGLKELEEFGYLIRERVYENGKIEGVEYNIYEEPQIAKTKPTNEENLSVENQVLGNRPQLSTKELNTKKDIKNRVESSSPVSASAKKDSKLFRTEGSKSNKKVDKWLNHKMDIVDNYEFSGMVTTSLYTFLKLLAEMNALVPDVTIESQLNKLINKVPNELDRFNIIESTITRGWKSLDYMINEFNKSRTANFDTAKNSQNQFYTEAQKKQMQKDYDNASEDDLF